MTRNQKRKRVTIQWRKQPRQIEFLRACGLSHPFEDGGPQKPKARIIFYGGAAGGGKSDALLMAGIVAALTFPGCSIGYFRRQYPQLEGPGGAIMRSHELLGGLARYNGSLRRWTFPGRGGSVLQFCHASSEEDVYTYQSQQFDVLLIDESTHFTRFQVRYLLTRNRATVKGIVPFCAMGSNPGNVGHGWHRKEFVDIGIPGQVHDVEVEPGYYETHLFIPSFLADNQVLEQMDPGYRATLEAQPEAIRKALLDGNWDVFEGQYFTEFSRRKHVTDPGVIEIQPYWRRFVSIDWGYADPCAVYWHAVDDEKRVFTYREYYQNGRIASDVAKTILALSEGEVIDYHVASPDMWQRRGQADSMIGENIADEFMKNGVSLTKADTDRITGWMRMREYLADRADGIPSWIIFSNCLNLIRTLPELLHDPRKVEDVADGEDHAAESCRYALMTRPRQAALPVKKPEPLPWALQTEPEAVGGVRGWKRW